MTKAALAMHLKCTPRYINTLMRRRILPFVKTRGLVRFDVHECDRALQRFKTRSLFGDNRTGSPAGGLTSGNRPSSIPAGKVISPIFPAAFTNGAQPGHSAQTATEVLAFNSPAEARSFLAKMESDFPLDREPEGIASSAEKGPVTLILVRAAPAGAQEAHHLPRGLAADSLLP